MLLFVCLFVSFCVYQSCLETVQQESKNLYVEIWTEPADLQPSGGRSEIVTAVLWRFGQVVILS